MGLSGGKERSPCGGVGAPLPECTRVYINSHIDSTRWDGIQLRDGDTIVTTSYKAGTTWMQQIIGMLDSGDTTSMVPREVHSPWIDARFMGPKESLWEGQAARTGRRAFKSHLAFSALPYHPQARYIVVVRDPRDVFMSLHNHWRSYQPAMYAMLNDDPSLPPHPPCPEDPRELWRDWISRGAFPWESEGWPYWGNMYHAQSYWDFRHLPNVMLIHFADMKEDLPRAVADIARFCGYDASDALVRDVAAACTFEATRERVLRAEAAGDPTAAGMQTVFGSAGNFFHKGTNGRWRDVLTAADLDLYEERKAAVLSPDCAAWCENGGWRP